METFTTWGTLNIFDVLFQLFQLLLVYAQTAYNFIFSSITIGSYTFNPFFAIGGTLIITLIILNLAKEHVPFI